MVLHGHVSTSAKSSNSKWFWRRSNGSVKLIVRHKDISITSHPLCLYITLTKPTNNKQPNQVRPPSSNFFLNFNNLLGFNTHCSFYPAQHRPANSDIYAICVYIFYFSYFTLVYTAYNHNSYLSFSRCYNYTIRAVLFDPVPPSPFLVSLRHHLCLWPPTTSAGPMSLTNTLVLQLPKTMIITVSAPQTTLQYDLAFFDVLLSALATAVVYFIYCTMPVPVT